MSTAEQMAGRKRAAVELIAREGAALRKTAMRFSLCPEDAEDAYQRALEILLIKAPCEQPRELARWTQTVVKHEALAIRSARERLLGPPAHPDEHGRDRVSLLPASGDGPGERAEQREEIARSREALRTLKPAELRALTLLAAGYSYAEIGEITGFSRTKVNRCLAEGRERFRRFVSRSEGGGRCAEMGSLISAYCDGEAGAAEAGALREHLRACGACRATMRAYRAAPATVAALAPALPASRSLLERAHDLFLGLSSRLPGNSAASDATVSQVAAAGGTRGAGMAALAKIVTVCAGTVGGAAACVATGVAPVPLDPMPERDVAPRIERVAGAEAGQPEAPPVEYQPAPEPAKPEPPAPEPAQPQEASPAPVEAETGAVEYAPPPPAPAQAPSEPASSGSAAGEFGP